MSSTVSMALPARPASRKLPPEVNIFLVLVGISLVFEILGWLLQGQSFLLNARRLSIMILQVSVIGIIAIGVTQVIISGGIDLSPDSVVGATAMISMSLAQSASERALYPGLTDLQVMVPIAVGLLVGLACGILNGALVAYTKIPPFIATLGMMVTARGFAKWYTMGQPVNFPTESFAWLGAGMNPVWILILVAVAAHVALRYTRYGKFTYAIGANPQAARVTGINVEQHLVKIYAVAGLLAGLAGILVAAQALTAQSGMGVMYELDAIAMAVIGGVSLAGGRGSILGTMIGMVIFGVIISGFTFLRLDAYYQEMIKGVIIVAAVVADVQRQKKRVKKA